MSLLSYFTYSYLYAFTRKIYVFHINYMFLHPIGYVLNLVKSSILKINCK